MITTGGSSSVGATKTKVSMNGPNTTSGWSTSLAHDQNSKEISRTATKFNKVDGTNESKLYSNRMSKSKESHQQLLHNGLQEILHTDDGNYYKRSLLRTGKNSGKDAQ